MACHGVYKEGPKGAKGKCYNYDVLTNVCVLMRPIINVDTIEEEWEYVGGCFDNDQTVQMEKGVAGQVYTFDKINIEVRADQDPYLAVSKKKELKQFGIDLTYFSWLGWIFLVQFVIGFAVFLVAALAVKVNREE